MTTDTQKIKKNNEIKYHDFQSYGLSRFCTRSYTVNTARILITKRDLEKGKCKVRKMYAVTSLVAFYAVGLLFLSKRCFINSFER